MRSEGGEGLIAELVRAEKEGQQISPDEMVAMVFLLLGAGTETTAHLISGSIYELARNPKLRDWLAADWDRANMAIEEFLRYLSPVQFSKPRQVRKDVDFGAVTVKKGDRIMVIWRRLTWTRRPTHALKRWTWSAGPTGISRSARASTSASAISLRASKASARCRQAVHALAEPGDWPFPRSA